jgi:hypothetical protein
MKGSDQGEDDEYRQSRSAPFGMQLSFLLFLLSRRETFSAQTGQPYRTGVGLKRFEGQRVMQLERSSRRLLCDPVWVPSHEKVIKAMKEAQ